MKNLELKFKIDDQYDTTGIDKYYIETIIQTDRYFNCRNGRLKLRIEDRNNNMSSYGIFYERQNICEAKESIYYCYNVENHELFTKVFGNGLIQELEIIKVRKLFLYKNARIHVDDVNSLGKYLEIEVVINNDESESNSKNIMKEVCDICNIDNNEKIDCGYRELLLKNKNKTFDYYKNTNKVFWYVNKDIDKYFKANDIVPCIYVENKGDKKLILQFDESIKFDEYKYTVWRKFIGKQYNIHVDVLLICNDMLINLNGDEIKFQDLGRSDAVINKDYLAKFDNQ